MEEEPDKETEQLLELIAIAQQFMDDMTDMYNDSLEYYLNRVIGLDDEMEELEGASGGSSDDDEGESTAPKGGKGKNSEEPNGPEAKKDCKQQ